MSDWAPVPRRPLLNQGIFQFEEAPVRITNPSPIEQQRTADGSPITRGAPCAIKPMGPKLTLNDFEQVNKSMDKKEEKPKLDADAVVKSFLAFKG